MYMYIYIYIYMYIYIYIYIYIYHTSLLGQAITYVSIQSLRTGRPMSPPPDDVQGGPAPKHIILGRLQFALLPFTTTHVAFVPL